MRARRASRFTKAGSIGISIDSGSTSRSLPSDFRNSRSEPGRTVFSKLAKVSSRKWNSRSPIQICGRPRAVSITRTARSRKRGSISRVNASRGS